MISPARLRRMCGSTASNHSSGSEEIGLEHGVRLLWCCFLGEAFVHDAGVVDQHIQAP
jgi:hypothetical protein